MGIILNNRETVDIIQQRIKANLDEGRPARSERLKIGNEFKSLPVISMPTSLIYFNPHNHRLSAQIKDSNLSDEVFNDPFSEKSQNLILQLLAKTDDFGKLKGELKDLGQRDPGLIMRDGLLVNGNTRCAALRTLGNEGVASAKTMDVAVLPEGITEVDISDIEMELQMLKLTHQRYTFANELLFMESYRRSGKSDQELVAAMGWQRGKRGEAKVKKLMRILGYIEEVKKINPNIPYDTFNTKKTHLEDMDLQMQALINGGDHAGALELKNLRLLGLLIGMNKDKVREIDGEFFLKLITNINDGDSSLQTLIKENSSGATAPDPDFDDDDFKANSSPVDSKKLLQSLLTETSQFTADESGEFKANDAAFADLTTILSDAAERSIQSANQKSRNQELSITLRGITSEIHTINAKLPDRVNSNDFKSEDFVFELEKAMEALQQVQRDFDRFKKK
jgi:hypothetical protein